MYKVTLSVCWRICCTYYESRKNEQVEYIILIGYVIEWAGKKVVLLKWLKSQSRF